MKRILIGIVVLIITAGAAFGQLSTTYSEWIEGPVQHLMTKEEKNGWKLLKSDEEAKAFIDLFWARRDPTPQTPRNEFREEFETRVAVADREFSTLKTKGSLSDPGKVLILLGSPSQVGSRGAEARSQSNQPTNPTGAAGSGIVGLPSARAAGARQVWTYRLERKPKFVKQKELDIVFIDEGGRKWQMATTERTNPNLILQQAVDQYIFSPHLTEVPVFFDAPPASVAAPVRVTSFRDTTLREAYESFRAQKKTAEGPAHLTWGEFVTPSGDRYVPVQLYVPASAGMTPGRELTFFGVVTNEAGEIVDVQESAATLVASGKDVYVDRTLRLEPGNYIATFGLAAEGRPVAMTRTEMNIQGLDPSESGISPLLLSNNIYPRTDDYGPMDPFTFGGLKVVPKGDAQFSPAGDLWYFFEMRNPGLSDQGTPKVQVKIDIDGKTAQGPVRMNIPMGDAEIAKLKGTENRYAVGMTIPLESFVPGEYTMKMRVVDSILKKNYDLERKFQIRP